MRHKAATLPELVQTSDSFDALVDDLGRQARIAVDTESNSLHAYRERVCVMQFSTSQRDYVVDALALDTAAPLGAIFASPRIEKIFHAAEYDILCLRRDYGFTFNNIFDTMQAGRILGSKLAGLDRLLQEKFGVEVNKRLQKANWGARPLSPELLEYAAQDTHYLIPLRDLLEQALLEKGLLELAQEDFRMACADHNHRVNERGESPAWARLSGRRDITPRELTILKELLDWRDLVAQRLDRPPFKGLGDERLIELARARPTNREELKGVALPERPERQWGLEILQAVDRGLKAPLVHRTRPAMPAAVYLKRLELLKAWRKKTAAEMDVESDVVLPRGLLLALADGGAQEMASVMSASPWRQQRFGDQISAVLQKSSS